MHACQHVPVKVLTDRSHGALEHGTICIYIARSYVDPVITTVSFHGGHKRQHGMPKTEVVLLYCETKHGKAWRTLRQASEGNGSTHAATILLLPRTARGTRVWHYYYGDMSRTHLLGLPSLVVCCGSLSSLVLGKKTRDSRVSSSSEWRASLERAKPGLFFELIEEVSRVESLSLANYAKLINL